MTLPCLIGPTCLLVWLAFPALAQTPDAAIRQNLLQRQQQLEAFELKGEQSRQLLEPTLSPQQKTELSRLHTLQRQDQQALQRKQQQQSLLRPGETTMPELQRLDARALQFERERQLQLNEFAGQREAAELRMKAAPGN